MKGQRRRSRCAWPSSTVRSRYSAFCEWPTSRLGRAPSEKEILFYDVLPEILGAYVIGLVAIAITRLVFPKSSIKVVLYVVVACAVLVAFLLKLSVAISGAPLTRDFGGVASLFALPLAIATWVVVSAYRSKRKAL